MIGKPVLAARATASVLFPDPARPVMTTRRPMAARDSLMTASVTVGPPPGVPGIRRRVWG